MLSLYKKGFCPFLYLAIGVLIMSGCATPGMNTEAAEKAKAPVVESHPRTDQLDRMEEIIQPKDWSPSFAGKPRKVTREDLRLTAKAKA